VISADTTWAGIGHALLILAALWWAWASYAWPTNTVDAGGDGVLAAMLGAMAAMFVAALAVPDAFGGHGVLFGVAFPMVAIMHLALHALSARSEPDLLAAILRIALSSLFGASRILAAGFVDGRVKSVVWIAASLSASLAVRQQHRRLAPAHFVERHGRLHESASAQPRWWLLLPDETSLVGRPNDATPIAHGTEGRREQCNHPSTPGQPRGLDARSGAPHLP
jgi:low temperature requirement protein LtrA